MAQVKEQDFVVPAPSGDELVLESPQPPSSKGKPAKQRTPRGKDPSLRMAKLGMTGQGFVKIVKETGFGFISCPDLDEQLFFHASELIRPEIEEGPPKPFMDLVAPGDEVEFVVGQNTGSRMNFVAQKVRKLPAHTVKASIVTSDRYLGRVTTELNSGNWRSQASAMGKIAFTSGGEGKQKEDQIFFCKEGLVKQRPALKEGDLVQFQICLVNHEDTKQAVNIEAVKENVAAPAETILHGFIKDLSKTGGVIRCIEHDRRYSFRAADVLQSPSHNLRKGQEVMFSTMTDSKGHDRVTRLDALPEGSLEAEKDMGIVYGRVVRSLRAAKAGETGLLATPGLPSVRAQFIAETTCISNIDPQTLDVEDELAFHLIDSLRNDVRIACDLELLCKAKEKRELGQVRTLKSNFGFVVCCQRSGQLFFHASAMVGCGFEDLKKGDDVEFSVERHPERGTMAVRVKRMPPGSAVFETVSEATYKGLVASAPSIISAGVVTSGVLDYFEDGLPLKLLFTAIDFQEEVRTGDYVTFQIANNEKAAKQVESLGSVASHMIGKHATKGKPVKLEGIVRQILTGYGFIEYTEPDSKSVKRLFYHSSEVVDQVDLGVGDTVSFILTKGPKLKDNLARKVVRTAVVPVPKLEESPPVRVIQKPVSSHVQPVRTPAMPDGTRGFHMGRGGALPQLPIPQSSLPARVPGKLLTNTDRSSQTKAIGNEGGQLVPQTNRKPKNKKKPAQPSTLPAALLSTTANKKIDVARTFSGHVLNPNAVEFQPKLHT